MVGFPVINVDEKDLGDVRDLLVDMAAEVDFSEDDGSMELGERLIYIGNNVSSAIGKVDEILGVKETIYYRDRARDNRIFVFGSNLAGYHGAGAAYIAMQDWGAKYGVGFGPTGKAYAIPTKDENIRTLPLECIAVYTGEFATYAKYHPELTFLVTRIGCGLAGYTDKDIAPLFSECVDIPNVVLPFGWGGRNTE